MSTYPEFSKLMEIMKTLRSPRGCPWDKEQTHISLLKYLHEEAFEVIEAALKNEDDHLCEELGDLMLQVVFHAVIAEQRQSFTIQDVLNRINQKLEHRHPHVFNQNHIQETPLDEQWDKLKAKEKQKITCPFSSIPASINPWHAAERLQLLAAKDHFDWEHPEDILEKIEEECRELREELNTGNREKIKEEAGDLLFSVLNFCRFLKINPEECIRDASGKFQKRYLKTKQLAEASNPERPFKKLSLTEKEAFWQQAKKL